MFAFDLGGRVGYLYSLVVLVVLFFVARRIVHSPFGYGLKAIRDNARRATAIGIGQNARLAIAYTISAAYAGTAGALLAQTTGFASLDVLDFHRSADVLLVLVIGGVGWLYGGVIGAVVFKLLHDFLSTITPQYWQGLIGVVLVVLVLVGRERLGRGFRALLPARWRGEDAVVSEPVLQTRGLQKRFGGIAATQDVSITLERGARQALIGPNGAGKTTLVNLLTGMLEPTSGAILLDGVDITRVPAHQRARRGLVRTFQISQLFDTLTPLETLSLVDCTARGRGAAALRAACTAQRVRRRGGVAAATPASGRRDGPARERARIRQAAAAGDRDRAREPAARAAARRTDGRRAVDRLARDPRHARGASRRTSP